jgi:hypothetical protein
VLLTIIDERYAHDDDAVIYELRDGVWLPLNPPEPPKRRKRATKKNSPRVLARYAAPPSAPPEQFVPEPYEPSAEVRARQELRERIDAAARVRSKRVARLDAELEQLERSG